MSNSKPMPLLLIEDDIADCIKFQKLAELKPDITFVGITNSSDEGLMLLTSRLPQGVILDLQLTKGKGTGLQFLAELNKIDLAIRPIVIVTTSNQSPLLQKQVEGMGVDWVFCKSQSGYSAEMVIDTMLTLRESLYTVTREGVQNNLLTLESPEDRRARIYKRIDTELDLIGVSSRYKGRGYLRDAIYLQIHSGKSGGSMIEQVAVAHKTSYSTISRVIQTAINNAWDSAGIDELKVHYTARISMKTGVPSAPDFIHFYAEKIGKNV